ncbi:MAG: hypothetical protein M1821_007901 [Bathelium mastoideum]|nr:MAG: hypothetical protein M1821_007901 [Bathelium mastoideum]KAI9692949.1 MAG: hypothetical protein M1822_004944 [Bathelium mastoideum]
MSASPQKEPDVEPGVQSPDDTEPHMDREAQDTQAQGLGYEFEVKEQDRWLPIANARELADRVPMTTNRASNDSGASDANIRNFAPVARIMKTALPENAKIAKEAKECMQECVSEFISFITSEASEKCQQEKRKTVNGEDILFAMTSLGFENYAEALKIYLARYRETLIARGENQNKPAAPGTSGSTTGSGGNGGGPDAGAPGSALGGAAPAAGAGGPVVPSDGSAGNAAAGHGAGPGAPYDAPTANHNVMSAGLEGAETDPGAFGYHVGHNGSAGEF